MRLLLPLLFGFTDCAETTMPTSEPAAVSALCGEVLTLPASTFATSALMVGTVEAEPGVYDTYAAPIAWEQVGLDVYVECPADKQIDASIHSIVVYYAPTL